MPQERIQKLLSAAGVCSRRKAEEYIAAGRVGVEGRLVRDMGVKVDPARQRITLDGKPVCFPEKKITVLLNKPAGFVTTMHDPQGRPVVGELVNEPGYRLFPVGRLDFDTEGALLLTNDGELAQRILHPSYEIKRSYEATVSGIPNKKSLNLLRAGIMLEGRQTAPAKIQVKKKEAGACRLLVVIHEGRKRQVRKMFAAIGHPVLYLKRVAYGGLGLGGLATGSYRRLTADDIATIWQPVNSLAYTTTK